MSVENKSGEGTSRIGQSGISIPQLDTIGDAYISLLQETSLLFSQRLPFTDILRSILLHAGSLVDSRHACIYLKEKGESHLKMRSALGCFQPLLNTRSMNPHNLVNQVFDSNMPRIINDYATSSAEEAHGLGANPSALLFMPFREYGKPVGVLGMACVEAGRNFDADALHRLLGCTELLEILLFNEQVLLDAQMDSIALDSTQAHLRQQNIESQLLLDMMPARIWVKDRDNRILRANQAGAAFLGKRVDEVQNQWLWDLAPELAAADYRADLKVLDRGESILGEPVEDFAADGSSRWVKTDRIGIFDDKGMVDRIAVVSIDVTEQHLAKVRVQASREAADRATRIKSRYFSTMNREIRQPLQEILTFSEELKERLKDSPHRQHCLQIREQTHSLLSIINNVLDFSRIEAGNLDVEIRDFEIRSLIEDVLDVMARSAYQKGLELLSFVDAQIPWKVAGDPTRLRQILINLISNAIRFTKKGEVMVLVKPVASSSSDTEIRFEVKDTGIGIETERLPTLFEPYFQANPAETDEGSGNGLGLPVAARLVQLMHGDIGVESEIGEGSLFWCNIGFETAHNPEEGRIPFERRTSANRILVVAENFMVRNFLQRQLSDLFFHADLASSMEEIESFIQASTDDGWPYAMWMVDSRLLDLQACERLEILRAQYSLEPLPLVLMTPFGSPVSEDIAGRISIAGCLSMPVRSGKLQGILAESLLEPSRSGRDQDIPGGSSELDGRSRIRVMLVEVDPWNRELLKDTLEHLGCDVTDVDTASEGMTLLQDRIFDGILLDSATVGKGFRNFISQVRRMEGSDRHSLILCLDRNPSRKDEEQYIAAGADVCLNLPLQPGLLKRQIEDLRQRMAWEQASPRS